MLSKMQKYSVSIVLLLQLCSFAYCCDGSGNYSVVVPKVVDAGEDLKALLWICPDDPGSALTVDILDSDSNSVSRTIVSNPDGNALNVIDIQIDSEFSGSYSLRISNDLFETEMLPFQVSASPVSLLVQTDKPIYKPGQKVNLRVLAIDKNLRGKNESVTVIIADSDGNKIKRWIDRQTDEGLIQLELQLSSRPPLGEWTITVNSQGNVLTKTFQVDEYVLPKFEVSVNLPTYILTITNSLDVTVSARYTYGEDVNGTARIIFTNGRRTYELTGQQIEGEATYTLTESILTNQLALPSSTGDGAGITVTAFITDSVSEVTLNGSGRVSIYTEAVKVTFMKVNPDTFRPGQHYIAYYEVSQPDGSRLSQSEATLTATASSQWYADSSSNEETQTERIAVPSSGICQVQFDIPSDATSVSLEAEVIITVDDQTMRYAADDSKYLSQFSTIVDNNYLQLITNVTGPQQVNDVVSLSVSSSSKSGLFTYMVISRGAVVAWGSDSTDNTVELAVMQKFTPQATLVVFAIVNGELLADSVTFNANGLFENEISMEFSNSDGSSVDPYVEPGTDINLTVTTTVSSIVGLLAVDKSVLLLGSGNDITQAQIESEIMRLITEESDDDCGGSGHFDFWWPYFGGESTSHVFAGAGLTFGTDANFMQCFNYEYDDYVMFNMAPSAINEESGGGTQDDEDGEVQEAPRTRTLFPETWLWDLFLSEEAETVMSVTVPDTITTWVTTALSLHPVKGLAVTPHATEITVKLPFFISPVLPYAAVRGEQLQIKIVVSNYGDMDEVCTITVDGSTEYNLKESENASYVSMAITLEASVSQDSAIAKEFWVEPSMLGEISITATATCNSGKGDSFTKTLLVKPPGFALENCQSKFVELTDQTSYTHQFDIMWPTSAVSGSHFIAVMATGDVLGPTIDGLDRLISAPHGCGEQNMITMAPSIFVRGYLKAASNFDAELIALTTKYMEDGYQRELTYKHSDGSFSAFGNSDASGSTWLTAFVLKCFRQSQSFIEVDERVLSDAENWLSNQIVDDGSFNEPGRVIHTEMQGGTAGGVTLTAFVVVAYLEGVENSGSTSVVQSTIAYLEASYDEVKDNMYALSVITYALTLARSDQAIKFRQRFESFATDEGGRRHWGSVGKPPSGAELYYPPETSNPRTVEMTSRGLLIYLSQSPPDPAQAREVANWLTEQRNSHGGYHSTQDTILALQALAAYASYITGAGPFSVEFSPNSGSAHTMAFSANELILTKKHWFSTSADQITEMDVTMNGQGNAIITACMGYNVLEKPTPEVIIVATDTTRINGTNQIIIKSCAAFTGDGESGMALMRIGMPTGYSSSSDDVERSQEVALIEYDDVTSELNIYFHQFTSELTCIQVNLNKDMEVRDIQDAYIEASQYYNSETIVRSAFNPSGARIVDSISSYSAPIGIQISCLMAIVTTCLQIII